LRGLGNRQIVSASELHGDDLKAVNTMKSPQAVIPRNNMRAALHVGTLTATLRPHSWNVIVTEPAKGRSQTTRPPQ
jgi:alpha-L-arabinofuranosidase